QPATAQWRRARDRGPGHRPGEPVRRPGLAALGVAAADLDAYRPDPAVPAGGSQRARVAAAAAGHRPGRRPAVLHLASGPGPVAGPAVPVQRVRRSLVRRDLPAAVSLAGGLRGSAHVPAGPV